MRIRKRAWTEAEIENNSKVINDAVEYKGRWSELFGNDNPIYVEVGCGKGGFITKNAKAYPDVNYIGIERQQAVVAVAARKVEAELPNVALVWENARNLSELFEVGEFQRLYLNFSDPWPKKRMYKRRLTYRDFLKSYREVMGQNAEIFFKTDNRDLFEFSLNEFCADDWKMSNISLDLHNSDYEGNIMTEYEEKFSAAGMPIYRLEARYETK
ncbi:tRNA (guanosine(46)-N7)-methyltransferase TrmB [Chakrabartyella piscis]|uniref:tRNA (guanosine(46)-N7)-methyltransferase TrmB n=1 Tax=Chakrabartyella piscis TaxID=2918914 RepID=UPI002958CF2F|nr:tRNA (guanosine(46)-N7)-methyltransferase TrmB [Chakrabartyella piscis]